MSLRSTPIDDDGFVDINDIGTNVDIDGNNALLCLTNNTNCCRRADGTATAGIGEWHFPTERGNVGIQGEPGRTDFYYRSRGRSVVRLNREGNPSERGRFRCELLGSTIHANICE